MPFFFHMIDLKGRVFVMVRISFKVFVFAHNGYFIHRFDYII